MAVDIKLTSKLWPVELKNAKRKESHFCDQAYVCSIEGSPAPLGFVILERFDKCSLWNIHVPVRRYKELSALTTIKVKDK